MVRDLLIAVSAGFIAAILSYLFGRIILRPRLHYSRCLRVRTYAEKAVTQFFIKNHSYWRVVTQLEFTAVVMLPFVPPDAQKGIDFLRVPLNLSAERALRLEPRQTRVTTFDPSVLHDFTQQRLKELGQATIVDDPDRTIHQLLQIDLLKEQRANRDNESDHNFDTADNHRTRLLVFVNCKDGLTGRDFSFQFGPFFADDVGEGAFPLPSKGPVHWLLVRTLLRPSRWFRRIGTKWLRSGFNPHDGQRDAGGDS